MIFVLAAIALTLTYAMFSSRNAMLGFPSAMFWAIFGAHSYMLSTVPWGDIYYYLAFASLLGMTTFTALGAFGLRERHDSISDKEMESGESGYIDEGNRGKNKDRPGEGETVSASSAKDDGLDNTDDRLSRRTVAIRERAKKRRSGTPRKGEFEW